MKYRLSKIFIKNLTKSIQGFIQVKYDTPTDILDEKVWLCVFKEVYTNGFKTDYELVSFIQVKDIVAIIYE